MSITFNQLMKALPLDLVEKIVRLKLEKERKADPVAFVMNGKTELTPYRKFHIFNHIVIGKVNMTSIKSFYKIYEQYKENEKFLSCFWRALYFRLINNHQKNDDHWKDVDKFFTKCHASLCSSMPSNSNFTKRPPSFLKMPRKNSKSYKAFCWFFAIVD